MAAKARRFPNPTEGRRRVGEGWVRCGAGTVLLHDVLLSHPVHHIKGPHQLLFLCLFSHSTYNPNPPQPTQKETHRSQRTVPFCTCIRIFPGTRRPQTFVTPQGRFALCIGRHRAKRRVLPTFPQ